MSTVTYKNQPAIHETRGAVPLEGNTIPYTVGKVLWPGEVEQFLQQNLIGKTLHVCCGKSKLGDVRLDLNEMDVDVQASMDRLPFPNECFDTLLIDPPYNSHFQIMHDMLVELSRVAKQRIIFQHWFMPVDKYGRYKKNHKFQLSGVYLWQPKTYFGRVNVISILDRI